MPQDPQNLNLSPTPSWFPDPNFIKTTHIYQLMQQQGFTHYEELHRWSVTHCTDFWQKMVQLLSIAFEKPYSKIVDLSRGVDSPQWFLDAKLNIVNSCFQAPKSRIAIISKSESNPELQQMSYGELEQLSNRIANSLNATLKKGDAVAIIMTLTPLTIAIYLGVIKAGGVCVSIAESFATQEIKTRLLIAKVTMVFTQDYIIREEKVLPLYEKVKAANAPWTVVLDSRMHEGSGKKTGTPNGGPITAPLKEPTLRAIDHDFENFLSEEDQFTAIACEPNDPINILFSSGTTGEPKAIPWTQVTPIKCATDAYLHHNLQPQDIFCWPSSLGWMMGPWLIFATLINQATMALFEGVPSGKKFGTFIQDAKVTHLGLVPTLVKTWRASQCMEDLDWSTLKVFSSTGETSNREDMLYLMSLAKQCPIIEYCGGTEIGGAYITGTVVQPAAAAAFTTPALGLDVVILDETGKLADRGEVAIIPPSIGLSTELLNQDHHKVYYENMPNHIDGRILRRHGDQIEKFANGFYRLLGRADDTMNLSGIKISAAEIEQTLNGLPEIFETAAIAINPADGGPSKLVIFAVLKPLGEIAEKSKTLNKRALKIKMQNQIKTQLNPQFRIQDVVIQEALPRTASNKIMRRILRDEYRPVD